MKIFASPMSAVLVASSRVGAWSWRSGSIVLSRTSSRCSLSHSVGVSAQCPTRLFAGKSVDGCPFHAGQKVQVEIVSFGPLGASADVIGLSHDENEVLLAASEEPYGRGLILQKEIHYFREARDNVDVVRGEVLPAYIQSVREDGKVDVGLREFGGKAKAQGVGKIIMDQLEVADGGILPVGDRSKPQDINKIFPGVSKTTFKKAVGALYKQGLIKPGPNSISLSNQE